MIYYNETPLDNQPHIYDYIDVGDAENENPASNPTVQDADSSAMEMRPCEAYGTIPQ